MTDIEQIQCKGIDIRKQRILPAFPLPLQQILISPFQSRHSLSAERLQEPLYFQKVFFIKGRTVHLPSTFHQIVGFVNEKQIISFYPFRKKTF